MPSRLVTLLKILFSLACLAALWFWIEPAELAARLRGAAPIPFAAAMALSLLGQPLNAVKLRALFPPPRPRLRGLIEVNFVSIFLGTFLPGGLGGELARWAYLSRESGSAPKALAAVLLDRLTGLWAQILAALAAWIWLGSGGLGAWTGLAASGGILLASVWLGAWGYRWFTAVVARLGAWYARRSGNAAADPGDIGAALAELMSRRGRFARVAALSAVNQALTIAVFVLIDRTAGGTVDWAHAALYILGYSLAILLPLTFGSIGVGEGALGLLYRSAGSQGETGILVSLLMRVMNAPAIGIGWICFLARRGKRDAA